MPAMLDRHPCPAHQGRPQHRTPIFLRRGSMLAQLVRALTAREVAGVRATLELAERERVALAAAFYARLFETDPATRKLFTIDMAEQGRKLLEMLDAIADGLDQPSSLV